MDEGGTATFTITADPAPQSDLTIAWTVAQSGEYLDAPGAGSRTVVLTAGAASTDLPVATVDDDANEADGSISVTLNAGTDYTVATGKGSAAVTVRDNDAPVVSITAGSGVTEGTSASFTVSASPVPAAPLDVVLTIGQSGDVADSNETGSKTLTIPVSGSVTFEVATVDDAVEEPNGTLTATVGVGTGYTVAPAPDNAATVTVSDNDAVSSGPTISIADAAFNENERYGYFTVTLSEKTDHDVRFAYTTRDSTPVSATANADYVEIPRAWRIGSRIKAGKTQARFWIPIRNDSHDEDPETFEVEIFDAFIWRSGTKVPVSIADGVAVGTITNSDPMPAAWLARFGRATAEQALDGIAGRIADPRSTGMQGAIAGQAINFDSAPGSGANPDGSGGGNTAPGSLADNDLFAQSEVLRAFDTGNGGIDPDRFADDAQSHSMTAREVLLGSSFTATGEKDVTGGSLAFWGRAAQSSFDGQEGMFSLDGETTTTMLGADYARDNWLVGMALMQSRGKGKYADTDVMPRPASQTCPEEVEKVNNALCSDTVRDGDGRIEASMTAAVPYASIQASERLKLWGALGYGTGEVTLKPDAGTDEKKESYKSDISWNMMAVGGRRELLSSPENGPTLVLTGDALWARTESDRTNALAASDSDVTRLRLGLEGSWRIATEGDGSITPKLELGVRQDGGDAETGSGMELGAGIAWSDPGAGLSLDLSGRTLITHTEEDLENEGFSVSFHYDPKPASARGLELSLRQEIGGPSTGGLDALFASGALSERSDSDEESRLKLEAAYGFPVFSGQYIGTPGVSLVRGSASRDYSLGWHFTPAKSTIGISFGVKATRRESEGVDPEHAVGVEASVRW